jgi:hypothetical protein
MYELKRRKKLTEELALKDDNNKIVQTLKIEIDPDAMLGEYVQAQNAVIRAKEALSGETSEEKATEYGNAVVAVLQVVLGAENTEKLLTFYENRYSELLEDIWPYIMNVINPLMKKASKDKTERMRRLMLK